VEPILLGKLPKEKGIAMLAFLSELSTLVCVPLNDSGMLVGGNVTKGFKPNTVYNTVNGVAFEGNGLRVTI